MLGASGGVDLGATSTSAYSTGADGFTDGAREGTTRGLTDTDGFADGVREGATPGAAHAVGAEGFPVGARDGATVTIEGPGSAIVRWFCPGLKSDGFSSSSSTRKRGD